MCSTCVVLVAAANCTVECVDNFSPLNLMDLIRTIRARNCSPHFVRCCGMQNVCMWAALMMAIFCVMLLCNASVCACAIYELVLNNSINTTWNDFSHFSAVFSDYSPEYFTLFFGWTAHNIIQFMTTVFV